ncbi:hypothetical protein BDD14_6348 [Edaphobacter modestus]|uniref:Uncharacterized protein n=1 Tax=Edaphobacter modestus TaxID=388466 RepID=A0A4Q7Y0D0_9BACT|nr:hypothetical protein BDD14_6348 [Edaphobacter modestus]
MWNKAFRVSGKRWIVRSGQFGNGPLPNWILNTHLPFSTLGRHKLKPTDVLI